MQENTLLGHCPHSPKLGTGSNETRSLFEQKVSFYGFPKVAKLFTKYLSLALSGQLNSSHAVFSRCSSQLQNLNHKGQLFKGPVNFGSKTLCKRSLSSGITVTIISGRAVHFLGLSYCTCQYRALTHSAVLLIQFCAKY